MSERLTDVLNQYAATGEVAPEPNSTTAEALLFHAVVQQLAEISPPPRGTELYTRGWQLFQELSAQQR